MKTFMTLDEAAKQHSGQIRLAIPETIVCTYDSVINFLYTDQSGILRTRIIKPEEVFHLAHLFYEKNLKKAIETNTIYPISITKTGNDSENETKLDFFINSMVERFNRSYQKCKLIIL
jgi:hypothetical protein